MTPTNRKRSDYGIDAPYAVTSALSGGLLGVSAGLILRVAEPSSPYWSIPFLWGIVGLAYALVFFLSSKGGKLWLRDRIIDPPDGPPRESGATARTVLTSNELGS